MIAQFLFWLRPEPTRVSGQFNPIQLEISIFDPIAIVLKTGMKIRQLVFETVDATPDMGYTGRFSVQGPER